MIFDVTPRRATITATVYRDTNVGPVLYLVRSGSDLDPDATIMVAGSEINVLYRACAYALQEISDYQALEYDDTHE
jgi:hypothetical protein